MWLKIDDNLIEHPKIYAAGRLLGRNGRMRAFCTYMEGLSYVNRHLTDGVMPSNVVEVLTLDKKPSEVAKALVRVKLWERTADGYQIHDYHAYNPRAADVKEKRAWDKKRKELYADQGLVMEIKARDRDRCRYCGRVVSWTDRRSDAGAQFDHVSPRGDNSLDNVVVACRGCNCRKSNRSPEKAGMRLLPPPGAHNPDPKKNQNGTSSDLDDGTNESFASCARDSFPDPVPVPDPLKNLEPGAVARRFPLLVEGTPSHELLCRLAREELLAAPAEDYVGHVENLKTRCAQLHMLPTSAAIKDALDAVQLREVSA